MQESNNKFLAWLEFCAAKVNNMEAEIKKRQEAGNDEAVKEALLEKAAFVSSLAKEGQTYMLGLDESIRDFAKENLAGFSENADWALKLKSYFYMSTLLHTEEHQPGAPNLLNLFTGEIRARLQ